MDNDAPRIVRPSPRGLDGGETGPDVSDTLFAALAHELRNALGPVRTAAYLLRASVRDDTQAQWALDLIDRQVLSITAAIDELADLARLRRGTLELGSDVVDLREALDMAASACATALAEKRQALDWTRPADRIAVRGDPERLAQALAAVLRATSSGAVAGTRISVQTGCTDAQVGIHIGETPEGEPRATRAGDNATAPSAATVLAASIGLTLAQGIFGQLGGSLAARVGPRFAIRLPLSD